MNEDERKSFDAIIDGWEKSYKKEQEEAGEEESPISRVGFYSACLRVVRDGPPMKYPETQRALIEYYTQLKRVAMRETYGLDP